ncbi:hypothetical protein [Myxococcus faecalis]|uniref:hypothetical protein n=1 Tax=Myxococcus faecalis TaxID=3115646 RepID=UPI003CF20656
MNWHFVTERPIPVLTNGNYSVVLTDKAIGELRAAPTLEDMRRILYEKVSRQRNPQRGLNGLDAAFNADGRPVLEQLQEIRDVLPKPLPFPVNTHAFSDNSLEMLHTATREAFDEDESRPPNDKRFFVREYSDWKDWSDRLENEMRRRNLRFEPIPW